MLRDKLINTFITSDFTVFIFSDKVVIRKSHPGLMGQFSQTRVMEFAYRSSDDLGHVLAQVRLSLKPQPSDRWFLGLPLKYFTLVDFSLPRAAQESLEEAVRYSLIRHVPYDLDQALISYVKNERAENLDISSMTMLKQDLKPFLRSASAEGITFDSVFPSILYWAGIKGDGIYVVQGHGYGEVLVFQNDRIVLQTWGESPREKVFYFDQESDPALAGIPDPCPDLYLVQVKDSPDHLIRQLGIRPEMVHDIDFSKEGVPAKSTPQGRIREINLLPRAALKQRKLSNYLVLGGIIFFLLSLMVWPASKLAGQKRMLAKLEDSIESVSVQAEELNRMREDSRQIMDSIEAAAEMKKAYPSAINILRELTEVMPDSAWVLSLNYSNRRVTIQGEAESATSVIEAVENSPFFREVRFSSPVTRSGARDKFTLVAEVIH